MIIYRIAAEKYARSLTASGVENRWNNKGQFVIYCGSSRSLAVLEMTVHRASIHLAQTYNIMCIEVESDSILKIANEDLAPNWTSSRLRDHTQKIGSAWYRSQDSLILQIPSVIIPQEANYMLNTSHPLFSSKVTLDSVEGFSWDRRLLP